MYPHENVSDPEFFRRCLGNALRGGKDAVEQATCQYGNSRDATGQYPNYRWTYGNGEQASFSGRTHQPDVRVERYDDGNLTPAYAYAEVEQMYVSRGGKPRR
jgi:hypothetical protein